MTRLPRDVSGAECIRVLERAGFTIQRRNSSHVTMRRDDPYAWLVVPDHDEIKPGTLRSIIRQAGLTVEEFVKLL